MMPPLTTLLLLVAWSTSNAVHEHDISFLRSLGRESNPRLLDHEPVVLPFNYQGIFISNVCAVIKKRNGSDENSSDPFEQLARVLKSVPGLDRPDRS